MKKQKLSLDDLKVSSFVTNLEGKEETVAGGFLSIFNCSHKASCGGCTEQITCNPGGNCEVHFGEGDGEAI